METGIRKAWRDTEDIQRGFQECFTQTVPVLVEVFEYAVLGKRDSDEVFSLSKNCSLDTAYIQCSCVVDISNIIEDTERIPLFYIIKVYLPGKDIGYIDCQQRVYAFRL